MNQHRPGLGDRLLDARKRANDLRVEAVERRDRWAGLPLGDTLARVQESLIEDADADVARVMQAMRDDELGRWSLGGGVGIERVP